MNNPVALVFLISVNLAALWAVARKFHNPVRTIIFLQIFFWSLSYVMRPLILLFLQPPPRVDDSLADFRLAAWGYETAIFSVLQPVLFGLFVYTLALVFLRTRFLRSTLLPVTKPSGNLKIPAWVYTSYLLGWIARILWTQTERGTFLSAFSESFSWLALVALAVWIRNLTQHSIIPFQKIALLGFLELAWSILFSSKTPIFGFVTLCLVFLSLQSWRQKSLRFAWGLAGLAAVSFPFIQSSKSTLIAERLAAADSSYPELLQPFLSALRRFDLLSAATDAYFYSSRGWLNPGDYVQQLLLNLVPQQLLGLEKIGAGTLWSIEVRAASTGFQNPDVSLAEGFIAEGYVLAGYLGVFILAIVLSLLVIVIGKLIVSPETAGFMIGSLFLSFPVLFERGALGASEILGKALQVVAIAVLIRWIFLHTRKNSKQELHKNVGSSS